METILNVNVSKTCFSSRTSTDRVILKQDVLLCPSVRQEDEDESTNTDTAQKQQRIQLIQNIYLFAKKSP